MIKKLLARLRAYNSDISQSGQGILEYILLLVIIVLVTLGLIYRFNTAFSAYLDNHFGSYLACLLETGELPSLGGDGVTQGECDALHKPFNLSDGRPLVEPSDYKPGGGGRGRRGGGGRSGGSYSRYGGGGNAERSGLSNFRPASQTAGSGVGEKNRPEAAPAGSSDEGGGFSRRYGRSFRRKQSIPSQFVVRRGVQNREKSRKVKNKKDVVAALRKRIQKMKVSREQASYNSKSDPGIEFNISAMLKWLVIIAIIVALVVFLGGQIVQIRKSWEKGD